MVIRDVKRIFALNDAKALLVELQDPDYLKLTGEYIKAKTEAYVEWGQLWKVLFLKHGITQLFAESDLLGVRKMGANPFYRSKLIFIFKRRHWWNKPRVVIITTKDLQTTMLELK